MRKIVLASVVMLMASAASANLIVQIDKVDLGDGYYQFRIHFIADTMGDAVSCFDGRFDGQMYQRWYYNSETETYMTTATLSQAMGLGTTNRAHDSHLMLVDAAMVYSGVYAPVENNPTPPGGTGTWLAGAGTGDPGSVNLAIGIDGAYQTLDLLFAQIVLSGNQSVHMVGNIAQRKGGAGIAVDEWIIIPEPSAMLLLAAGGVMAMLRRRRN